MGTNFGGKKDDRAHSEEEVIVVEVAVELVVRFWTNDCNYVYTRNTKRKERDVRKNKFKANKIIAILASLM